MPIHVTDEFFIYFGTKLNSFVPQDYYGILDGRALFQEPPFRKLCADLVKEGNSRFDNHGNVATGNFSLDNIIFFHQVHGTQGRVVGNESLQPFSEDGDFVITQSKVLIGVLTADCLPIVFYDKRNHVGMVVHAGWKGAVQGVIETAVGLLQKTYATDLRNVTAFFGACANVCCYQVGHDVEQHLVRYLITQGYSSCANHVYEEGILERRADKLFFNQLALARHALSMRGVPSTSFVTAYNACTMCHSELYCSHRRSHGDLHRQMTVMCLRG